MTQVAQFSVLSVVVGSSSFRILALLRGDRGPLRHLSVFSFDCGSPQLTGFSTGLSEAVPRRVGQLDTHGQAHYRY